MAGKKAAAKKVEPIKPEGYQILGIEVANIMRVKIARIIPPQGSVVTVSGRNGQGKTSLLRSIDFALTGTSTVPSHPIRNGAASGHIKVDIGPFIITRTFTRVDPTKSAKGNTYFSKLFIEGKDRATFKTPQELLNSFMGAFTFDPLAFMRLDPYEQFASLRKVAVFSEDIDALEKEKKAVYDERRIKNRELEAAQVRLAAMPEAMAELPQNRIDTAPIIKRLQEAGKANEEMSKAKRERAELESRAQAAAEIATDKRAQAKQLLEEAAKLDGAHIPMGVADLKDGQVQSLRKAAAAVQIPEPVDVGALTEELEIANNVNAAIARRGVRDTVLKEVADLQAAFDKLHEQHKDLDARREKAIAEASMPIESMTVGNEEVLLDGLPFSQASTAGQIRASAAMAIALSPKLRVMRILDGSLLDTDSMKVLEAMASENNYQIWVERVAGDGGPVGIVMEDGEASGEGVQA